MERPLSILAVAVSTGRVAYVYFEGDTPRRWGMSRKAAKDTQSAARIVGSWIDDLTPDLLISENPKAAPRKGPRVKAVLETISTLFENAEGLNMRLTRQQSYQNKYQEAMVLAAKYPMMKKLCPVQPPIWMPEPRNISYFEALSFVEQVKSPPPQAKD